MILGGLLEDLRAGLVCRCIVWFWFNVRSFLNIIHYYYVARLRQIRGLGMKWELGRKDQGGETERFIGLAVYNILYSIYTEYILRTKVYGVSTYIRCIID